MKPTSLIPFLAVAALLLAGCSADELFKPDQDHHISFSTRLPATRAAAYEETGANAYTSMGVYATVDGVVNLMTNQVVTRTAGSNGWSYTPTAQWPSDNKAVSFYAYAPHDVVSPTQASGGTMPLINNFIVAATAGGKAADQVDLLLAEAISNTRDSLTADVQLTMRHVLTRVLFSARTQHPYAAGVTSIQISKIELTGLHNRSTHNMDAREFWTAQATDGTASNAYTLTSAGGGLAATDLTNATLAEINTADGNLYLMPQVLTNNTAKLQITVTTVGGSNAGDKTYTFALIDLLNELKQGESLRFLLTVPNDADPAPFQIEVHHGDWNAEYDIDADIDRDPVLYISNETVYAYDGAVTCVYFSSNVPPNADADKTYNDIIYIEAMGRIGSNTGATFQVKDEFYAIAQNDPDRDNIKLNYSGPHINNLRYEYDTTAKLYKGHLDIVQRKTTAAGETPNQGKQPLILKLHVGRLVRDITVQRVVTTEAAKQNPTRYVGTFHRHYETGERIVTWHEPETTTWRIEKDNSIGKQTDRDELQLDTRISPDFRNKQLYTLVARNPEGTRVEQNDNLFGRGRVYFRVGWNTPTNGTTNRYARVKVTLQHHNVSGAPTTSETHYLYCRQGDTEEQIAAAPSQYALYNIVTPGQFARYPSQTGMLYQWNRLVPWSPLGDAAPYGWNTNPNDYETSFSYERSACPDGYVYPSSDQETEMKAVFAAAGGTARDRGYYADGYFDRRAITYNGANPTRNEHRVNVSNTEIGAIGTILFNSNPADPNGRAARSIFLVSGGLREADGTLLAYELTGHDDHGVHGGYWFDLPGTAPADAKGAWIYKQTTDADIKDYSKRNAHSLRCIRANGWLLVFDANGGENGPRNITVPSSNTTITLPATKPNNFYRDNYLFMGWSTNKDGSGTLYNAGQVGVNLANEFGAASTPARRIDLYAKWEESMVIDFGTYSSIPASYLYNISTDPSDRYASLTAGSNGTSYQAANTEEIASAYFNGADKAYPVLEFSAVQPEASFATAYQACKDRDPAGTWRLPRAQEVVLIQKYTTRANEILGDPNDGIWTGTTCSTGGYLFSFRNAPNYYTSNTTGAKTYRCVRPATP